MQKGIAIHLFLAGGACGFSSSSASSFIAGDKEASITCFPPTPTAPPPPSWVSLVDFLRLSMRAKLGEGRLYGGRYGSRETRALNFDQTMGQRERERERRSGREMTSSSPKWIPIFSFHSFNTNAVNNTNTGNNDACVLYCRGRLKCVNFKFYKYKKFVLF